MIKKIKKIIFVIFLTGLLFLFFQKKVFAEIITSGSSARLLTDLRIKNNKDLFFYKIKEVAIKNILERYNSPLKNEEANFILTCKKYDLDCYLLPSIAGLESTFGRFIWPESYNPFGWGGGYIMFKSWEEAIDTVGAGLRKNYINKWGLNTVEEIGPVYSESPTWAKRVNWFINEFKKEEEKLLLLYSKFNVKL